jgi:hypothetical protein
VPVAGLSVYRICKNIVKEYREMKAWNKAWTKERRKTAFIVRHNPKNVTILNLHCSKK